MRDTEKQREKQAPCREPDAGLNLRTAGSCPEPKEPDAGLNLRTAGSCPEPKADAQPPSHPGVPA